MIEISPLTESDRAEWEALSRDYKAFFNVEPYDDYDQAFRRLRDDEHLRGITARLNGKMVGLAHYYFHVSIWEPGHCRCYMQDLFVSQEARRHGVARALIEWMTQDAEAHGATRLHWHTTQDNSNARAFYDTVGRFKGFITYTRPLNAEQNSARG